MTDSPPTAPSNDGPTPGQAPSTALRDGLVVENILCRRCGYSLFRLSAAAACPECGKPVVESLRGDFLAYCDETYLKSLERGATLILWSIAFLVLSLFIMGGAEAAAYFIEGKGQDANRRAWATTVRVVTEAATTLAGAALTFFGWWLFSTPDPGVHLANPGHKPRRMIRAMSIIIAIVSLLEVVSAAMDYAGATLRGAALAMITSVVWFFAWLVHFLAAMNYITWLAPRIPSAEVAAKAKLYRWLLPLLTIVVCGIGAIISLVLYSIFMWQVRKLIRGVRPGHVIQTGAAGAAPGTLPP